MKTRAARTRKLNKIVITRSRKGNLELAGRLKALGFEPVAIDTIEFLPPSNWTLVDGSLSELGKFDWVLFTSPTGVEFFLERMRELNLQAPWNGKPAVAAVGEATAAALRAQGISVDFVPSEFLTSALARQLPRNRGEHLLILRADIGDPSMALALEHQGFLVRDISIYRTTTPMERHQPDISSLEEADALVFASPSSVEALADRLDSSTRKRLPAICIGPVTAEATRRHGFERIIVAQEHSVDGLIKALLNAEGEEGGGV